MSDFGTGGSIAQINHTLTRGRGTIRGMHYQRPRHDEAKFVSCLEGVIFDVAIDIRPDSPTNLQWHGEILSAENARSMMIPGGFAHGFQTLTENCELTCTTSPMRPSLKAGSIRSTRVLPFPGRSKWPRCPSATEPSPSFLAEAALPWSLSSLIGML